MRALGIVCIALALQSVASAHSGGLDRNGGHVDHSTGMYHMHGGGGGSYGSAAPMYDMTALAAAEEARQAYFARARARNEARTEARTKAKMSRVAARMASVNKPTGETRFAMHHRRLSPYQAQSFEDADDAWETLLAKGFVVNLTKADIIRIEAVADPTDPRTWIDDSGKYSTVARFVEQDEQTVVLESLDRKELRVPVDRLSSYDQDHLDQIRKAKL